MGVRSTTINHSVMAGPVSSCRSMKIGFPGDESRECLIQVWNELSAVSDVLGSGLAVLLLNK